MASLYLVREALFHVSKGKLGPEVDDEAPLISTGLVTSLGILGLISVLETRTGIKIPAKEITRENFNSINAIARVVDRYGIAAAPDHY